MSLAVWKFQIPVEGGTIELPAGSKLLKVADQQHESYVNPGPSLQLWALVNPDAQRKEQRDVLVRGTGHSIDSKLFDHRSDWELQDTILCMGGRLVLHVWISA